MTNIVLDSGYAVVDRVDPRIRDHYFPNVCFYDSKGTVIGVVDIHDIHYLLKDLDFVVNQDKGEDDDLSFSFTISDYQKGNAFVNCLMDEGEGKLPQYGVVVSDEPVQKFPAKYRKIPKIFALIVSPDIAKRLINAILDPETITISLNL